MKLKLDEKTAKRLYTESPEWFQAILIENFGEKAFAPKNFTDFITFDDICRACDTTEEFFNSKFNDFGLSSDTIAYEKLKLINKAINGNWTADWNNSSQRKYYPYFNLSSGFGFSTTDYFYAGTYSLVGSRLCYESTEKCEYAAKQFISIYKDFFTK